MEHISDPARFSFRSSYVKLIIVTFGLMNLDFKSFKL